MNADMLNRGTEYSPTPTLFLGGGAANAPSAPPLDPPLVYIQNIGVKQAKIYSKFPQKPPNKTKLEWFPCKIVFNMHGYHYWKYKCILLNITGLLQDKMHIYLNCSYMTMSSSTYHLVSFHNFLFSTCIRYYNILFRIHLMRPNWA